MKALFGQQRRSGSPSSGSSGSKEATAPEAIAKLQDTTETLQKRVDHLQFKIDKEVKAAKAASAAGDKRAALTCIKRKKMYEKQLDQCSGSLISLEANLIALQGLNVNAEVIRTQRLAAAAMAEETRRIGGVEGIEESMDQLEEAAQEADEIGEVMANAGRRMQSAMLGDVDDDELLDELAQLEMADQLTTVGATSSGYAAREEETASDSRYLQLPVPGRAPVEKRATMEDELAQLEMEMAMAPAMMAGGTPMMVSCA